MMNRKTFLTMILVGVQCIAPALLSAEDSYEAKARETLNALKQAYVGREAEAFFRAVSDEPHFDWQDFKSQITQTFRDFSSIDLVMIEDNVLVKKDTVVFKIHWQKRMMNNRTGKLEMTDGAAELQFKAEKESGPPHLINIRGSSPF